MGVELKARTIVVRDDAIRARALEAVEHLPLDDRRPWSVIIKRYTKPRTLDQNALYHAGLGEAALQLDSDAALLHEALKDRYCPPKPIDLPDGTQVWVKSTRLLDTREMSTYMERVHAWLAGVGVEFSR